MLFFCYDICYNILQYIISIMGILNKNQQGCLILGGMILVPQKTMEPSFYHCLILVAGFHCSPPAFPAENPGLPRLVDAAVSAVGPEMFMLQSWRGQLGEDRLEAQHWLGWNGWRMD